MKKFSVALTKKRLHKYMILKDISGYVSHEK